MTASATTRGQARDRQPRAASRPVVTAIREAILEGEFVAGQRLVEADLSAQFTCSRAAVRAALLELAGEGLVERVQNRGARVRAVQLDEAIEITEVRMVVEGLCAAKAAERISADEIAELNGIADKMRTAVREDDLLEYSRLNEHLHARIRQIGGQRTASDVLERLRAQNVRHQFRLAMHPGRPAVSLPEHLALIAAICAHQPEAASAAAQAHLRSVISTLSNVVVKQSHWG